MQIIDARIVKKTLRFGFALLFLSYLHLTPFVANPQTSRCTHSVRSELWLENRRQAGMIFIISAACEMLKKAKSITENGREKTPRLNLHLLPSLYISISPSVQLPLQPPPRVSSPLLFTNSYSGLISVGCTYACEQCCSHTIQYSWRIKSGVR